MNSNQTSVAWTTGDSRQASHDGCDIFDCEGKCELQRDADTDAFADDAAAAAHVKARAALGDPLAQKAVAYLVQCCSEDVVLFSLV